MADPATPLSGYQRRLFVFLGVATFFEGYDFLAFFQILPHLRRDMGLSEGDAGWLLAFINFGTMMAYLLIRKADGWGRKPLLTVTIAGYTLFTFLTSFAPEVYSFAICQFLARIFLLAECATSMMYAAEEFPADRRGMVIGVINAASSLGSIVCAGVAPLLTRTSYGWRSVYLVGILPLVILAFARRNLRETQRFTERAGQAASAARTSLFRIWRTPYRRRLLHLAAIWACVYVCSQNAVSLWKDFALNERGLGDGEAGLAITFAALGSAPLIFAAGKLLDVAGRKRGAAIIFLAMTIGVFLAYTLQGQWPLTFALTLAVFGVSSFLAVLNAFTAELFPTDLRGDAFAWSNNLLGRITYVLSPIFIGMLANEIGWSTPVRATTIFPVIALILVLVLLPETRNRELEETSNLA